MLRTDYTLIYFNMKEIKFKVWDKVKNEYIEDVLIDQQGKVCRNESQYYDNECNVMQYTGLKDKNGKEIYEGDIINKHYDKIEPMTDEEKKMLLPGTVVSSAYIYGRDEYNQRYKVEIPDVYNIDYIEEFEVIGNIYENPNLML